jgi:hypothetical protein
MWRWGFQPTVFTTSTTFMKAVLLLHPLALQATLFFLAVSPEKKVWTFFCVPGRK